MSTFSRLSYQVNGITFFLGMVHAEYKLRVRISILCSKVVPFDGFFCVLRYTVARFIAFPKHKLSGGIALFCLLLQ